MIIIVILNLFTSCVAMLSSESTARAFEILNRVQDDTPKGDSFAFTDQDRDEGASMRKRRLRAGQGADLAVGVETDGW